MSKKRYSQTSRDRLALNFFILIPVVTMLVVIHRVQTKGLNP